jgi:hypothetical protein
MWKKVIFGKTLLKTIPKRQLHDSRFDVLKREVEKFDASIPIQSAVTPPSVWFHDPLFHDLDKVLQVLYFTTTVDAA